MAILRVKDAEGNIMAIPAIQGPPGPAGGLSEEEVLAIIAARKPYGSYDGNGGSETIEIDTGVIDNRNQAVLIRKSNAHIFSIVTMGGYLGKNVDAVVCGIGDAKYDPYTGIITINSSSELFNSAGEKYHWFML